MCLAPTQAVIRLQSDWFFPAEPSAAEAEAAGCEGYHPQTLHGRPLSSQHRLHRSCGRRCLRRSRDGCNDPCHPSHHCCDYGRPEMKNSTVSVLRRPFSEPLSSAKKATEHRCQPFCIFRKGTESSRWFPALCRKRYAPLYPQYRAFSCPRPKTTCSKFLSMKRIFAIASQ